MCAELLRFEASFMCCAVVIENGRVTEVAPIVKYMLGWSEGRAIEYAGKRGWKVKRLSDPLRKPQQLTLDFNP